MGLENTVRKEYDPCTRVWTEFDVKNNDEWIRTYKEHKTWNIDTQSYENHVEEMEKNVRYKTGQEVELSDLMRIYNAEKLGIKDADICNEPTDNTFQEKYFVGNTLTYIKEHEVPKKIVREFAKEVDGEKICFLLAKYAGMNINEEFPKLTFKLKREEALEDVDFNVPKPHRRGFYLTNHLDSGIDHILKNQKFLTDEEIRDYGLTVLEKATTEYESAKTVRKIYMRLKDELKIDNFQGAHEKAYALIQDYFIDKVERGEIKSGSKLLRSVLPEEEVQGISDTVIEAIGHLARDEAEEILSKAKASYDAKRQVADKIKKHVNPERGLTKK